MTKISRTFSPTEKARIALVALRGEQTLSQISSEYQVHPTQIGLWKKQVLDNLPELFKDRRKKEKQAELVQREQVDSLYKIIGQRDLELDWLKKKVSMFNP
jgi:transposase-like protein